MTHRLFSSLRVRLLASVVVAGLLFRESIGALYESPRLVGFLLLLTGLVLIATRLARNGGAQLDATSALAIGLAQAISLLPGLSRTGMTVAAGLLAGVRRERVVRFSFLLSLPAVVGASILELNREVSPGGMPIPALTLVVAFVTALVSGLLAIQVMLRVVTSGRLTLFGLYCIAMGVAALVLLPNASR